MKARYSQDPNVSHTLEVLKQNEDGTVDLGRGKEVLVTSCPVAKEMKVGHAVLIDDKAPVEPKDKAPKEPKK